MELNKIEAETYADRKDARSKWLEYSKAEKVKTGYFKQQNPLYKDMKKLYHALKEGRVVINMRETLVEGGVHNNGLPKLAICRLGYEKVHCTRWAPQGRIVFSGSSWRGRDTYYKTLNEDIDYTAIYEAGHHFGEDYSKSNLRGTAPVPMVPPQFLPTEVRDDYYILWEVDEWKDIAPVDPWLCRRLTKEFFITVAGWDLTPLERAVMNSQLHSKV